MRAFWRGAVCLLVTLGAGPLAAQDPGYGGMGGMDRREGWRAGGERPARRLLSEHELEGPPVPDFFVPRFELDSGQAGEYRVVFDSFMSATAAIRDSALATRRAIDAAFHSGDRATARTLFPVVQQLGDSLAQEDERFDRRLKSFLSGGQLKAYKHWKDDERRQEDDARQQEMGEQGGRRHG
jgi:hypothetical protein